MITELDPQLELTALRARVRVLEGFLYDLDIMGGLGSGLHQRIRTVLGPEVGADIAAQRAHDQYIQTTKGIS